MQSTLEQHIASSAVSAQEVAARVSLIMPTLQHTHSCQDRDISSLRQHTITTSRERDALKAHVADLEARIKTLDGDMAIMTQETQHLHGYGYTTHAAQCEISLQTAC